VADLTDDDVLLCAVRVVMGVSVRAADQIDDLSPVQLRALSVLRENPRSNLVQLAEAMGVTVSTASRLVDRLIAGGMATRKTSPRTRREVALGLTRSGRTALQRYDRLRLESLRSCLEQVRPETRDALFAALRETVAALPWISESPPRA
jgi:DNA-binding MarR family transcriptional regulator